MIRAKRFIMALCILSMLFMTANADLINVYFDKTERTIKLDGELGLDNANSRVVALITKGGEVLPEFDDAAFSTQSSGRIENVLNMIQIVSDDEGNYKNNSLKVGSFSGNAKVYVAAPAMEKSVSDELFIPSDSDVNAFSTDISSATSYTDIYSLLQSEEANPTFGADMTYYSLLGDDAKTVVAEFMYESKKSGMYSTAEKLQNIEDDIFLYSFFAYLNQSKNTEYVKILLDIDSSSLPTITKRNITRLLDFNTLYGNSVFEYVKSNEANEVANNGTLPLNEILNDIIGKNISSPKLFLDALYISTIQYKFDSANGWKDAYTIISNHLDVLDGINDDKLDKNKDNYDMLSKIILGTYASVSELVESLNNWQNTSNSSGGSSGSSGKKGSSGGGGSISLVAPQSEINSVPVQQNYAFNDIADYEWAVPAITYLNAKNVVSGRGDGSYNPSGSVTREEFVKMIVNTLKIDADSKIVSFTDVDKDAWYYNYISEAVSAGIINGVNENAFGVGQNITRQDMAVIVFRALKYLGINKNLNAIEGIFSDSEAISDYAKDAVSALYEMGIVNGQGNNCFAPKNSMNRAEAAVVMYNIINTLGI